MPLTSVLSVRVRPDRQQRYAELVQNLAEKAKKKRDSWKWTAHQTVFGRHPNTIHFVSQVKDFAALAKRGLLPELIERLLGAKDGETFLRETGECVMEQQYTLSIDRPDLSYPPDDAERVYPAAVVTVVRTHLGRQEAAEELIRKVAEAIPKVGDAARIVTYQTMLGDISTYWTVRPLQDLSELDRQLTTLALLEKAFGTSEGGLVFRSGGEAIQEVERSVTIYREELSNR